MGCPIATRIGRSHGTRGSAGTPEDVLTRYQRTDRALAAAVLEDAEPDALAYLDFPQGHWKRLCTNNLQERANREIKHRPRVVQGFPSAKSLERLAGTVMCEQDDAWSESRYCSERSMAEPYTDLPRLVLPS